MRPCNACIEAGARCALASRRSSPPTRVDAPLHHGGRRGCRRRQQALGPASGHDVARTVRIVGGPGAYGRPVPTGSSVEGRSPRRGAHSAGSRLAQRRRLGSRQRPCTGPPAAPSQPSETRAIAPPGPPPPSSRRQPQALGPASPAAAAAGPRGRREMRRSPGPSDRKE